MLVLCAGEALAGAIRLAPDAEARVEMLPSVTPGRVDIAVHDNRQDLAVQVQALPDRDLVRAARAIDLGGDWIVTLWLRRHDVGLTATRTGAEWHIEAAPIVGAPDQAGEDPVAALADSAAVGSCPPVGLPLPPLPGFDVARLAHEAPAPPRVPTWTSAEPSVVAWSEVDDTRALLAHTRQGTGELNYRLGALHRDLGHLREAAWYFGEAARLEPAHSAESLGQLARAQLRLGQGEAARATARRMVAADAPVEIALAVSTHAAWIDHDPRAVGLAAALVRATPDPDALVLGGRVLAARGCGEAASDALTRALPSLDRRSRARAQVLLGDALLLAGDPDAARSTWASVTSERLDPGERARLRVRTRLASLQDQSPAAWQGSLADLRHDADRPDAAGAEALFALAQVHEALGDDPQAIDRWAELARRFPALVDGESGRRLWEAMSARLGRLFDEGRTLDALAVHRAAWVPALAGFVQTPEPLRRVARAYAAQGLVDRSLDTWKQVAEIERAKRIDGRGTVVELARLYAESGSWQDALDAISWLHAHPVDAAIRSEVAMIEGAAASGSGDVARARAAWERAARDPERVPEAKARIALMDARSGRCAEAVPPLQAAGGVSVGAIPAEVLDDALVRCLLALGRSEEASVPARRVAGAATNDAVRAMDTWRAARLDEGHSPLLTAAASSEAGVWGALAREEADQRRFSAKLRGSGTP